MITRANITRIIAAITFMDASSGAAQQALVPPPILTLRVEQPAYTGLPIWLHLTARDECLEHADPTVPWPHYLWLRDDGAEVQRDGKPVAKTPFTEVDLQHTTRLFYLATCVVWPPQGPERDHIFALSGAYIFDTPGHYRIRWTTRHRMYSTKRLTSTFRGGRDVKMQEGDDKSAWFDFSVAQSTPEQREAWLTRLLLQPPEEDESTIQDYIPALVTAWRDTRATRALMNLACGHSQKVSVAAIAALLYDLDTDATGYLGACPGNP